MKSSWKFYWLTVGCPADKGPGSKASVVSSADKPSLRMHLIPKAKMSMNRRLVPWYILVLRVLSRIPAMFSARPPGGQEGHVGTINALKTIMSASQLPQRPCVERSGHFRSHQCRLLSFNFLSVCLILTGGFRAGIPSFFSEDVLICCSEFKKTWRMSKKVIGLDRGSLLKGGRQCFTQWSCKNSHEQESKV